MITLHACAGKRVQGRDYNTSNSFRRKQAGHRPASGTRKSLDRSKPRENAKPKCRAKAKKRSVNSTFRPSKVNRKAAIARNLRSARRESFFQSSIGGTAVSAASSSEYPYCRAAGTSSHIGLPQRERISRNSYCDVDGRRNRWQ